MTIMTNDDKDAKVTVWEGLGLMLIADYLDILILNLRPILQMVDYQHKIGSSLTSNIKISRSFWSSEIFKKSRWLSRPVVCPKKSDYPISRQ